MDSDDLMRVKHVGFDPAFHICVLFDSSLVYSRDTQAIIPMLLPDESYDVFGPNIVRKIPTEGEC